MGLDRWACDGFGDGKGSYLCVCRLWCRRRGSQATSVCVGCGADEGNPRTSVCVGCGADDGDPRRLCASAVVQTNGIPGGGFGDLEMFLCREIGSGEMMAGDGFEDGFAMGLEMGEVEVVTCREIGRGEVGRAQERGKDRDRWCYVQGRAMANELDGLEGRVFRIWREEDCRIHLCMYLGEGELGCEM